MKSALPPLPTPEPARNVTPTPTPTSLPPLTLPESSGGAATPTPGMDAGATPVVAPSAVAAPTPAPTVPPTPVEATETEAARPASGCGAAPAESGWADLAMAALIAAPLVGLCRRAARHKGRGYRRN